MNRLFAVFPLALWLTAVSIAPAQAIPIVSQPPQLGDTGAFLESDLATPFQVGDIFSLTNSEDTFDAIWYGIYVDSALDPATPFLDDFTVGFYAVNAGVVDITTPALLTGADLTVVRSATPVDTAFGFPVFSYSARLDLSALAIPVTLTAGDYLISVANDSTGAGDVSWFWRTHSTGTPQASGRATAGTSWDEISSFNGVELAYTLSTVPVPPSIGLMLGGLVILGASRHRNSRAAT